MSSVTEVHARLVRRTNEARKYYEDVCEDYEAYRRDFTAAVESARKAWLEAHNALENYEHENGLSSEATCNT